MRMNSKRKYHQYSEIYLQFGFIPFPLNVQLSMCLLCGRSFSNEATKPLQLLDYLKNKHAGNANESVLFFWYLTHKFGIRNTITGIMTKCLKQVCQELLASYKVSYLIA